MKKILAGIFMLLLLTTTVLAKGSDEYYGPSDDNIINIYCWDNKNLVDVGKAYDYYDIKGDSKIYNDEKNINIFKPAIILGFQELNEKHQLVDRNTDKNDVIGKEYISSGFIFYTDKPITEKDRFIDADYILNEEGKDLARTYTMNPDWKDSKINEIEVLEGEIVKVLDITIDESMNSYWESIKIQNKDGVVGWVFNFWMLVD
ncbi:MAG: hypothetical protein A2Y24_00950 [Clostridiales bacterium GWE2_32_10]|nr:MAG: hypothetical protein A2Y24_00950 [Clostridiales bacterium GWE2_32_10]HBY19456.1 hypothetical protein [Clostridiales bacterium]